MTQMGAYCLRIILIMISMTMRPHFGLSVTHMRRMRPYSSRTIMPMGLHFNVTLPCVA